MHDPLQANLDDELGHEIRVKNIFNFSGMY